MAIISDTTNALGIRIITRDDPVPVDPELTLLQARVNLDKLVKARVRKTQDERRADELVARIAAGETLDLDDPNIFNFEPT